MPVMSSNLYDALIEAKVSPAKAKAAAEEQADYETRFASVETSLTVLKWMGGFNITMTVGILFMLLKIAH